jgi:hypothetical protein
MNHRAPEETCQWCSQLETKSEKRLLALADGASHQSDDVEVAVADILVLSDTQRRAGLMLS